MSRQALDYFQKRYSLSTAALVAYSCIQTRQALKDWCVKYLGVDAWETFLNAEGQRRYRQRNKSKVTRVIVSAETHAKLKSMAAKSNATPSAT